MSALPKLDARLAALAELVRPGARVADIGTDHGYLIAWLAASGKIPGGCACDIHQKPLEKAAFSLREYGVEDRVSLILCDGLRGVPAGGCDDIVIAGMGGDTIWSILDAAPWTRDERYRFILQPMTKAPGLRRSLCRNGFAAQRETAAVSGGFPYCAMTARYTGERREISAKQAWGGLLADDPSPAARAYIERVCGLLEQKVDGMRRSRRPLPELAEYAEALSALRRFPQEEGFGPTVTNGTGRR